MSSQRSKWEKLYGEREERPQRPASSFLRQHLPDLPRGRALDLASGDGRHALLLAENGFSVDAIDFAASGLRRSQAVARHKQLPVRCLQADLEELPLPRGLYAVVVNIRYLQRSLWRPMQESLREGGVIVFETFLLEQREIGHPSNPRFLLERGELASAFGDFEMIAYEEGRFEDGGEPAYLARMIARRPAPH